MDVQGEFIVTCGSSGRQQQAAQLNLFDAFVNVFDMKNMSSMKPMPFPSLAAHVRLHPRMLTTSIVVSQHGHIHVADVLNPSGAIVRYARSPQTTHLFEIAPSGEALVMADADSVLHLWGSPSKVRFLDMPMPVELPPPPTEPPKMDFSQDW